MKSRRIGQNENQPFPAEIEERHQYIVYDKRLLPGFAATLFDPEYLEAEGLLLVAEQGLRGVGWSFAYQDKVFVLRHYRRGGAVSRLNYDSYFGVSRVRSRPACEWRMLCGMRARGLPVPAPAAWRIIQSGLGFYRADLMTLRIPNCTALHRLLLQRKLSESEWRRLGVTLRQFHDNEVWHPDLNASNVLMDDRGQFHLVDFDRARFRRGRGWRERGILRLWRSLDKQRRLEPSLCCQESDFRALLDAYRSGA
ncbi:MAG: 3-deoxy-D-manno-octulosonic acid kinase [Thiotrichales bacterium]|nr:3-deoxy-D-manno-octulosonic acid kinase [Thiotrichales bacterium]